MGQNASEIENKAIRASNKFMARPTACALDTSHTLLALCPSAHAGSMTWRPHSQRCSREWRGRLAVPTGGGLQFMHIPSSRQQVLQTCALQSLLQSALLTDGVLDSSGRRPATSTNISHPRHCVPETVMITLPSQVRGSTILLSPVWICHPHCSDQCLPALSLACQRGHHVILMSPAASHSVPMTASCVRRSIGRDLAAVATVL